MYACILLVDDSEDLRDALRTFLWSKNQSVIMATDGAQAFAKAGMAHLILMDVVMAGLYGTTATRRIREFFPEKPIILMSGSMDQSVFNDILKDPNIRYLKKPLDLKLLWKTIQELLPEGGFLR